MLSWCYRNTGPSLFHIPPAQQEAQRAAILVERAVQERQQKIVQAEGEAQAAIMLGEAIADNPGYLKLRRLVLLLIITLAILNLSG